MSRRAPAGLRRPLAGAALAAACLLAGCDEFLTPDTPDEVRVLLDGVAARNVRLVTSHDFRVGPAGGDPGSEVLFVSSDTVLVALPFDRAYRLAPTNIFAVRVQASDADSGDVRLRVHLDGREVWSERSDLVADRLLQFYMVRHY